MELVQWFAQSLLECPLPVEVEDYLLGRGATKEIISSWSIKVWDPPLSPCPDKTQHHHYGPHFERIEGKVIYPLYSDRGVLLGFDSRTLGKKDELRVLFPEARWNAVWVGMPGAMEKIWQGADVAVCEGRYDVFSLLQVVGERVAVLGSGPAHMSWNQIKWLGRWALGKTFILYDNDDAGKKGKLEAVSRLSDLGVVCSAPPYGQKGDDPGSIWVRGGVEALREEFYYL